MYRTKRKGHRKKKGIKVLILLSIIALLMWGIYYFLLSHTVKTVYVEGNVHYSKEEIQDMIMEGALGNNSLYLSYVYKDKQVSNIPFVAALDVKVLSPDTVKIVVYEKALAGYIEYLNRYMYFDKDGVVVESSTVKTEGVPQITGLTFDHVVLNMPLPTENQDIFYDILTMTKTLNKYNLTVDRLYFNSQGEITLYFKNIRVAFGSDDLIDEKMMLLQTLLPKLEGTSGFMDLQNFDENTNTISFKPDN